MRHLLAFALLLTAPAALAQDAAPADADALAEEFDSLMEEAAGEMVIAMRALMAAVDTTRFGSDPDAWGNRSPAELGITAEEIAHLETLGFSFEGAPGAAPAPPDVLAGPLAPEAMTARLSELGLDGSAAEVQAQIAAMTPQQRTELEASGVVLTGRSSLPGETAVTVDGVLVDPPGYDNLALYRRPVRASRQAYPTVSAQHGTATDGYPEETVVSGTVVDAGSQRVCRDGDEPVSRWLRVRLSSAAPGAPLYTVVAVRCDELDARHYIGRGFSARAWKSYARSPVRMAHDDVPPFEGPLYVTYPGNVTIR